jgi:predicted phosphohydrolase
MLGWLSDIHMDHLEPYRRQVLLDDLTHSSAEAFVITGDISVGSRLLQDLEDLRASTGKPIYYVLGNHDYWFSSTAAVRKLTLGLAQKNVNFLHMNHVPFVSLNKQTALVGHDCWYDCRNGVGGLASNFAMMDWGLMGDYAGFASYASDKLSIFDKASIVKVSSDLADEGVMHIRQGIDAALAEGHRRIVVLSHIPPFEESHYHGALQGSPSAQPWFTCRSLGDLLLSYADAWHDVNFTLLSGHTHTPRRHSPKKNLQVFVAGARYRTVDGHTLIGVDGYQ